MGLAIQMFLTLALFVCLVMVSPWLAGALACALGVAAIEVFA